MKISEKIINLISFGIDKNLIKTLSENQINSLHKKLDEQITSAPARPVKPSYNVGPKGGSVALDGGKKATFTPDPTKPGSMNVEIGEDIDNVDSFDDISMQGLTGQDYPHDETDMAPDGMDDDSDNDRKMMGDSEIKEKAVSQQQQKLMGLALSVKKGDTPKSKVSKEVKKVAQSMSKKDLEDFASTKHKGLPKKVENNESYMDALKFATARNMKNQVFAPGSKFGPTVTFGENLEKELSLIIEKHLPAKITKKELLNILEQWEEEDDVIIKPSKPTTKPGPTIDPDDPYQPAPDVEPVPRASDDDEDVIVKPKKPITKPTPTIDPDDPYQPAPDVEPVPRAKKEKLPTWLSFDNLGLKFKK